MKPRVLLVGSSTGGPQALEKFLGPIAKSISTPILVVQHMPPTFTTILAEKLTQVTGVNCYEPKHGDVIKPGNIYLAPGDWHMRIAKQGMNEVIQLDQQPQVNFCRPAVDPMFETGVNVYGGAILSVVLTGMGSDGKNGAKKISEVGGRVYVQDEASSVVWGMPGAIAQAGLADEIKPIPELCKMTTAYMNGAG
jgi:two-component system chemotaxis response regulator CheB